MKSASSQDRWPSLCRLCLSAPATLTQEHVPPKSTGNRNSVDVEYLSFSAGLQSIRSRMEDGVALRVLCDRCNSLYGSRLGTGFAEFAKQVQASGRFEAPGGGRFVSAIDVFPARVIRQLLLSFLCAQVSDDDGRLDGVRAFIRGKAAPLPGDAPGVSLYFNASPTYRVVPTCGVGALGRNGRLWTGSEIAAPGFGALFSFTPLEDLAWMIGARPKDISGWAARAFDGRESMALRLPRLRAVVPHPIAYGSAQEVERWQSRKLIAWLTSKADDANAPNSAAMVWRPASRRRNSR